MLGRNFKKLINLDILGLSSVKFYLGKVFEFLENVNLIVGVL